MPQPDSVPLADVVEYLQRRLQPDRFKDYEGAVNGLQFENNGRVSRIAAAVDGTPVVVGMALEARCDLLLVHHGMFWRPMTPWTGHRADLIRRLVQGNLAVYSQHLPLDGHLELGNAAGLARALGFRRYKPFFARHEAFIGVQVTLPRPMPRDELGQRLATALGRPPVVLPGGARECRRIGICTGGAGAEMAQARSEGVDTFITGEGPHWTYAMAEDLEMNVFYGGHYATETFGVRSIAEEISRRFGLPWEFLDHPTGL